MFDTPRNCKKVFFCFRRELFHARQMSATLEYLKIEIAKASRIGKPGH
jgi:hypothetical protein